MEIYAANGDKLDLSFDVVSESEFELNIIYKRITRLAGEGDLIYNFTTLCYGADVDGKKSYPYVFVNSLHNLKIELNENGKYILLKLTISPFEAPAFTLSDFNIYENRAIELIDTLINLRSQLGAPEF